ncbi:hypothetical protein DK28_0203210 [Peptococcaceae bacterium SCADC1_2_3]|jgi:hypothetical protein|nr:hypothetical protein DK28_0203210 [Peptococcaceae bacterium SCADC1_2_3]KFI34533.1 hypothetical protein HY00_01030 [Peptococcaceae bacterium SCADC1_2_3]
MFNKKYSPTINKNGNKTYERATIFDDRHGFAMIEIILSVALIALTVISLLAMVNYSNKYKAGSKVELIAFNLARDKLECYMKKPSALDDLQLQKNGSVEPPGDFFGGGYEDYSCNISSQTTDYFVKVAKGEVFVDVPVSKLETITIKIYYRDPAPHQKPPVATIQGEVVRQD